ncbi:MAG: hypothetical protein JO198_07045 [Candidatus Dormibacteraeota bacterium]|nr:hypothetical protein [Candidatus Dormibacteraeota bacterium]
MAQGWLATLQVPQASHATAGEWLWCVALLVVPLFVFGGVFAVGQEPGRLSFRTLVLRPARGLEAATGRPSWSSAGVWIGVWALSVAAIGFFWDVAWHIDLGRDQELFTPPHTLIVAGLVGLLAAGVVSAVLATLQGAGTGFRVGRARIPWGAGGLIVLGAFATVGFPLDALWHATYGVDVTMWSPTHLTMISGAAFAPIAVWMLYREGGPGAGRSWTRRVAPGVLAGALVVALAAFQLEFDDGVPQWQMLYQPVLIALAGTAALCVARVALGPGWALRTAVSFLVIRGILTVIVGVFLGHVVTHFPLYIGLALCVEAAFLLARRRPAAVQAAVAGALAGTLGMASEWGWSQAWSYQPWQPRLLAAMWVALLAALGGAVLGTALGGVLRGDRPAMPAIAAWGAFAAMLVSLAIPFPRSAPPVTATVNAVAAGPSRATTDRYGLPSREQDVVVSVTLSPPDAGDGADVFRVIAWQGGGRVAAPMSEVAPGQWRTSAPVPTGGAWKTIVMLMKGDVLAASAVSMPFDPQYGQPPIPMARNRTGSMLPASALLMRESHAGTVLPQVLAYGAFVLELLIAAAVVLLGCVATARGVGREQERRPRSSRLPSAAAS